MAHVIYPKFHQEFIRDALDIRLAGYLAYFAIWYPAGYPVTLPNIRPDIRQGPDSGYPAKFI